MNRISTTITTITITTGNGAG
ncbi:thr operon leader peptide [Salmonella enterica]|uniref:thr operon leader peptide n=1 Tax=Salmonella enterica TaxID=28901 RepID=A0A744H138_SALER|nr:thr operon leader peptide [Salmonella enterica]EDP8614184.1 thr operon leader peptide [Salmonella enterica subsp. enterica]EEE1582644.1 thr operon leader peptide [Salmonella enterica subsp. enterica serovar Oranienburg]EEE2516514.1 thr operon leader peptide [Salmonella enterica subsp. enterica serovar Hato]EGE9540333.1 thr operon leader peptide [Salmonella enterica subsp. enterica serovar Anatum]HBZ9866663.1 thr operon leader peptide [Salmonella enterica subsp. houtenae]